MATNLTVSSEATIGGGGATSDAVTLDFNKIPLALVMPATFTGTTVTFQVSTDGNTYNTLIYGSGVYTPVVAAARFVALAREAFEAVKFFKIVSGSTEGSTRVIGVVTGE